MMGTVEPIYEQIGARIAILRKQREFTQQELADAIGLSRPTLVNMELGRQRIMIHTIQEVGESLGVPWIVILNESVWQRYEPEQIAEAYDAY